LSGEYPVLEVIAQGTPVLEAVTNCCYQAKHLPSKQNLAL